MSTDTTKPSWKAGAALFAIGIAMGGLWLFHQPNRDAEPVTALAANCGEFAAAAQNLFDSGENVTLRGTFAPGDHVHLAIYFRGLGYSWELTGTLASHDAAKVTGSWPFAMYKTHVRTRYTPTSESSVPSYATSSSSDGPIDGFARLEVETDVTAAGDGLLTIHKTGSWPSLMAPKVESVSCTKRLPSAAPIVPAEIFAARVQGLATRFNVIDKLIELLAKTPPQS